MSYSEFDFHKDKVDCCLTASLLRAEISEGGQTGEELPPEPGMSYLEFDFQKDKVDLMAVQRYLGYVARMLNRAVSDCKIATAPKVQRYLWYVCHMLNHLLLKSLRDVRALLCSHTAFLELWYQKFRADLLAEQQSLRGSFWLLPYHLLLDFEIHRSGYFLSSIACQEHLKVCAEVCPWKLQ